MGMSFLLPFFVVLGDGIESIVDSSLSCEESDILSLIRNCHTENPK